MKKELSPYLKDIYIGEYTVPPDFVNTSNHIYTVKQYVKNTYVPLNILSMWFNYKNALEMANDYEEKNAFEYDFFMTFRSDIIINKIPLFKQVEDNVLYSINQPCQFTSFGIHPVPIVSAEWVFAKKKNIKLYLETYDFIIKQSELDNNYICHYESNVTDNCVEKKINYLRIDGIKYAVDANRRRFENWETIQDTRKYNISSATESYIDINKIVDKNQLFKQQTIG